MLLKLKNYQKLLFREIQSIHVDVSLVNSSNELDFEAFKKWRPDSMEMQYLLETILNGLKKEKYI